jgi:glycosyltransferase involved in cell wall biosynthesis
MRILIINWRDLRNPWTGGAEIHIHEIASRLVSDYGHQVFYLCNRFKGDLPTKDSYDGIEFFRVGTEYTFNFHVPFWLRKNLSGIQPDLIIEDVNKIPFYTPLYVKRPVLMLVPHLFSETVFREVNFVFGMYVYLAEKLIPSVYKNCYLNAISQSTKEDLVKKGFLPDKISVIECGIDQETYRPSGEKFNVPTVIYAGRLKKYKCVHHLLEAVSRVKPKLPEVKLYVVGDGDHRQKLVAYAAKLNLKETVTFTGYISQEEKVELLQKSHLLVYPSIKEGWGISNLEANACGTPALAANVPGLRDSVSLGESGLLYPFGDVAKMAESILSILTDSVLREKLQQGGLRWASRFTWEKTAERFNNLLKDLFPS